MERYPTKNGELRNVKMHEFIIKDNIHDFKLYIKDENNIPKEIKLSNIFNSKANNNLSTFVKSKGLRMRAGIQKLIQITYKKNKSNEIFSIPVNDISDELKKLIVDAIRTRTQLKRFVNNSIITKILPKREEKRGKINKILNTMFNKVGNKYIIKSNATVNKKIRTVVVNNKNISRENYEIKLKENTMTLTHNYRQLLKINQTDSTYKSIVNQLNQKDKENRNFFDRKKKRKATIGGGGNNVASGAAAAAQPQPLPESNGGKNGAAAAAQPQPLPESNGGNNGAATSAPQLQFLNTSEKNRTALTVLNRLYQELNNKQSINNLKKSISMVHHKNRNELTFKIQNQIYILKPAQLKASKIYNNSQFGSAGKQILDKYLGQNFK